MTGGGARFITFEGVEGTGKSTQLSRLAERLKRSAGQEIVVTREPGGTARGRKLRELLLRPGTLHPHTELLLVAADRSEHLTEVVEPALRRGALVLCDRYIDASFAYQGYGRGVALRWIGAVHGEAPLDRLPDRTILLHLDPARAVPRARRRNRERQLEHREGRFEREGLDFHRRVAAGYLELAAAAPHRIRTVDADGAPEDVERRILEALVDLLPALHETP
jgi:dTMP kinase